MKYITEERFIVTSNDKESIRRYAEGWERTFGEKAEEKPPEPVEPTPAQQSVRDYLATGGEPSPIGWYGVFDASKYRCADCCDTGCVVDSTVDPEAVTTEGDLLKNCPRCTP